MTPRGRLKIVLVASAFAGTGWIAGASAAPDPSEIAALVERVGGRIGAYYQRAQGLICLERNTVTPIESNWSVLGLSRVVESELRVEVDESDGDSLPDARVTREILRVGGREPRERDKTARAGCTDPTPLSPEPLAFLLPGRRDDYVFTRVREGKEGDRAALIIDFVSAKRSGKPELIEDEYGHKDCFDWTGPIAIAGRIWVDAGTHDVLRLDRHIAGPTDIRVPQPMRRKYGFFEDWVTIDRDDLTLRYKETRFSDPDETILLPESIDSMTIVRGGLQSMRRTQEFSGYRRFLTSSRFIKRQ